MIDVAQPKQPSAKPGLKGPKAGSTDSISRFAASNKVRRYEVEPVDDLIRQRAKVARELNKLDQREAAAALGYKNSSQLSKIESGMARIPKDFIRKAAITYGVSADYLLGLSDEPERDPRTAEHMAVMRAVRVLIVEHTNALSAELLRQASEMMPLESHLTRLIADSARAYEAYEKVCARNKRFQTDVLSGSTLERAVEEFHATGLLAKKFIERRSAVIAANTAALCKKGAYPLLEELDREGSTS